MIRRIFHLIVFGVIWASATLGQEPIEAKAPTTPTNQIVVTASQVNGVYRYYKNEFRVLALGHNKLKIQFDGIYLTVSGSPNIGSATGEAMHRSYRAFSRTRKPAETATPRSR